MKRIQVNPASKQFRRIKGEVTLLSRLNHENIVRYYNAWIERHETPPAASGFDCSDSSETCSPADKRAGPGPAAAAAARGPSFGLNTLGLADDVEKNAPALASSVEWSTSIERSSSAKCSGRPSSEEEEDEDEEDVFGASFM